LKNQVASNPFLPVWQGELYLEYHRGTYTSMAKSKLYNRMSEQLLHELEFLASNLSMYEEYKYPQSKLDKMWKLVMLNQFHDILPGTSIEKVYVDSFEQYEEVFRIGNDLRNELLDRLLKYTGGKGLFVSNSLSFKRNDYVDVDGNLYYVEGIESYSVGTYEDKKEDLIPFSFEDGIVKTPFYKVEFNEKGNISSIYDFENNREVLKAEGNVFQVFEDKPHHYDAWDINIYYMQKSYDVRHVELTLKEKTPLRMTLRLVKHYEQSIIKQDIHFYHKNRRIDFETHIDWHEKQYLLKVAFPVDVHAESATYDVQFGNVKRPTHRNTSWDFARFEVVGHHYVDVSESTFGVSLLNNCKYGYDVFDSVLRLSLIKSATDPNPNADQGHHVFTYSLLPHTDSSLRTTIKEGYQLNYPLRGRMINHLDKNSSLSFVETDQNITIGTVKKALERDGYVIRVFDELNARTTFKLTFMKNIKHLEICNLHEECIEELPFQSNVFNDVLKPFEIKTYYVEFNHEV
jgi:alpha-mannosidase